MDDQPSLGSPAKLAKKAGVAPNSVVNMVHPKRRAPTKSGKSPSPTIEIVEKVAAAFDKEAWQLLHPDPASAPLNAGERETFEKVMRSIKDLRDTTDPRFKP